MKTLFAKKGEVERKWYVVDAKDQVLGRLATRIANYLRGKHKAQFTPHVDTGDFIIVVNAEKVKLTGNKLEQKEYYRHTGYPGGIRSESAKFRMENKPEAMIIDAVKGMLPKNRLGRGLIKKLKVYRGSEHPHTAQRPENISL
ncbi:MAG: 50S ribosomal protein L13 [Nitrospirota bacterium]|nr:MAG: 50S ribosomal protein L13 [Nitrospirota bacterium]